MKKIILILVLFLSSLYSYNVFKPVGFKATGMGGVGTANAPGAFAAYYNPALLLATPYRSQFAFGTGVTIRENNLAQNLDTFVKAKLTETISNITTSIENDPLNPIINQTDKNNLINIQSALSNLSQKNALYVSMTPYFSNQVSKNFSLGAYTYIDAYLKVDSDGTYDKFIFEDGNGGYVKYDPTTGNLDNTLTSIDYTSSAIIYAVNNGKLGVTAKGASLVEVPFTFANATQLNSSYFAYGINLKYMSYTQVDKSIKLDAGSKSAKSLNSDLEYKFEGTVGVDLGIAFQPKGSDIIFGFMGKNINSPTFSLDNHDVKLTPSYRIGISNQSFYDILEFAIDMDLTKNETLLSDEKTQNIGLGLEIHPTSWLSFRAGVMSDIATSYFDDDLIYTAGFGTGLKWGQLDVSAMMSQKEGEFDGKSIPKYVSVNISFISKWGNR